MGSPEVMYFDGGSVWIWRTPAPERDIDFTVTFTGLCGVIHRSSWDSSSQEEIETKIRAAKIAPGIDVRWMDLFVGHIRLS